MSGTAVLGGVVARTALTFLLAQPGGADRAVLCDGLDRPPADRAAALAALGDPGRERLRALAASPTPADAACGVAGLAALRDRQLPTLLAAALKQPAMRDDAYRMARWAAFAAGGPAADLGPTYAPVVDTLADPAIRAAVGDDAVRLLGEIDHPSARDRLVAELDRPQSDTTIDAVIHALARQGEGRPRARVVALGQEAVASRSGNLTYEQASRIGAVAFYLLALGPESRAEGLEFLRQMAPDPQADTAAWTVQTWCERAVRRPAGREAAEAMRTTLAAEFDGMGIRWRTLARGAFTCPTAP
ncbi:MAG: hypothetical protein AB7U83_25630 [Vicinamibacterales bacterium]